MRTESYRYKDGLPFIPWKFNGKWEADCIVIEDLYVPYLVEYINKNNIKKAHISGMYNFEFLRECPSLECLDIMLQLPFNAQHTAIKKRKYLYKEYDFEPLYSLPHLRGLQITNNEFPYVKNKVQIDVSRLQELEFYYGDTSNLFNLEDAVSLRSLYLNNYNHPDLQELSKLSQIDNLQIQVSTIKSLNGIQNFPKLRQLQLYYNRYLQDVHDLKEVKETLQSLTIDHCARIEDLSVMEELTNLKLLNLQGKNVIPNIGFANNFEIPVFEESEEWRNSMIFGLLGSLIDEEESCVVK